MLGEDRTNILVTALREHLQNPALDDALVQEIAAAYHGSETIGEQLKPLIGSEKTANLSMVDQQLDEGCKAPIKGVNK